MTVHEAAAAAVALLVSAGFPADDARADVSVLGRHIMGWTLADWAAQSRESVSPRFLMRLLELTRRRASHEPVAYITGVREFYGRPFRVSPDVLIPRPETEGLVEAALAGRNSAARGAAAAPAVLLDVGTGSGCIAITLALEWPQARVIATDVSEGALRVARANAEALGAPNIEFIHASLWPDALGPVDLIVSNPPYVPQTDRAALMPDVRDFEPASALFAGPNGLEVIAELISRAATSLTPGGRLILEIGAGQSDRVGALITSAGLELTGIQPDLAGIPRIVTARATRAR